MNTLWAIIILLSLVTAQLTNFDLTLPQQCNLSKYNIAYSHSRTLYLPVLSRYLPAL
jgi:hypothetical protein